MKPKDVSAPLTLPSNRVAVVVLNDVIPSKPAEFATVQNQIRDGMVNGIALSAASTAAQKMAESLRRGGNLEALAKADSLDVVKSEFGINDSIEGLGPANQLLNVFNSPVGTVAGPTNVQGRNIVYQVTGHDTPDIGNFVGERATEIEELKRQRAKDQYDLFMDSVMSQLRADKKVTINQDNLKKLAASYREKH